MGRGLPRTVQTVPDPRLQGVPEELAAAHQTLRLQRGQHPPAGGRVALPARCEPLPVMSRVWLDGAEVHRMKVSVVFAVCVFQRGPGSRSDPSPVICHPETSWLVWPTESLTALSMFGTAPTPSTHLSREYTCTSPLPPYTCDSVYLSHKAPVTQPGYNRLVWDLTIHTESSNVHSPNCL